MNFLVLDIGSPQADLFQFLAGNHEVQALSYALEGPGIRFANIFQVIDIKDQESVYTYAKEHAVDIIYSVGSDLGMCTAACVSDKLKRPVFVNPQIAKTCHFKT